MEIYCYCEIYQNFDEQDLRKYDCSIKKVYIDKLDEIVSKYSSTYHRAIKMSPADA